MITIRFIFVLIVEFALALAGGVYKVNVNSGSYLNVRQSPNTSSAIVGTVLKDKLLYVQSISNGWAKFYKGYCSSQYLTKVTKGTTYYTTDDLNFRTGAGTNYGRITTLSKGTAVTYFGRDPWNNGWGITSNGYCSMDYLSSKTNSNTKPVTQPVNPPSGSINLYTKEYKQYNYEYEYVGGCYPACTIHRYGCLITSITMTLNQVEKKNYTPVDMAKKMTFNGSGDATSYGSTHLKATWHSNTQQALQAVLNSLKKGRIAIYGSSGSSGWHFIAVYGYTGNSKTPLNAADFLIHDPGYSKSKLSEHINTHPNTPETIIYN